MFLGAWYLPIGVVLHSIVILSGNPQAYAGIAEGSFLPVYQVFFAGIVPQNIVLWATLAAVFELVVGVLIFSSGRAAKLGLLLSLVFQIFLIPMGAWGVINVLLVVISAMLLQNNYDKNMVTVLGNWWRGRQLVEPA
ncbi:MAG: hypothetical protein U0528_21145 [Anaerolineae bacterium]